MPGIDTSQSAVDIAMPYTMDVSGLNAVLFGEAAAALQGAEITVTQSLPVAGLFNSTSGLAWIHYIQDASENTYRALVNQVNATVLNADLSGCVNLRPGSTYSATSQTGAVALDISGAAPFTGFATPWDKYHSLQDMVISYFGIKILGHPGALAAISNDSVLRAAATAAVVAGFEQIYGDTSVACKDATGIVDFADKAEANLNYTHGYADGTARIMTEADCLYIIEQMMNVDPYRFSDQDKNKWQPLRWYANDKVRFQLRLSNNTFTVKAGGVSSIASATPAAVPGEGSGLFYQLVFTVA
jgi:hypothetical protein